MWSSSATLLHQTRVSSHFPAFGISWNRNRQGRRQNATGKAEEDISKLQTFDASDIPERWELKPDDAKVLCKVRSRYNIIRVLEISRKADLVLAGSRVLLLDKPGNIHSVHFMFKALTGSYYDAFASLPPLIPQGPVGILGLGAGTTARILHHFWPGLEMHGWELDPAVVGVGRKFFDLLDLEEGKPSDLVDDDFGPDFGGFLEVSNTPTTGKLVVHIGDALSNKAVVDGGFAGLMVDLFSEGKVIPQLQETKTWEVLKQRLKPGGRILVNCGGSCVEAEDKKDGNVTMQETFGALVEAFPGEVCARIFYPGDNCMALTGPFPDLRSWKRRLPKCLHGGVSEWRPCS